ncbi:serine hydrolase [Streptomyces sp. RKAG293]|uniref:serine hydrolase n=1 Tax=Streptomyces sp. RKAG293 TaxID=2893403 RepID=UPI00203389C7|nr:serine hydrolase [Streptomyces sp. RKAG293]MCM2422709.1 class A beta-lactamase-related serine hydrolase [Streptomyces sp. RKAG293]
MLSADIARAHAGRKSTIAFTLWDAEKQLSCADNANRRFDSASVVKVTIMGALLRRAEEGHRLLTAAETKNLKLMIIKSDNAAATTLWNSLGPACLGSFLRLAGMRDTVLSPGKTWGLTQITAIDEMKQLDVFASESTVLSPSDQGYGLKLMSQVQADQRWGAPHGVPAGIRVQVKNGWAPRATRGWRIHSLGVFTGTGRNYRMAVLTDNNATKAYGVDTIQRIAAIVHRDLNVR